MSSKSEKKNPHAVRYGTAEGEIQFGHITDDNERSAVMLRNGNAYDHYITMDQTGSKHRKHGTICNSPGAFQIKAGSAVENGKDFGVYIDAENGDMILRAPNGTIKLQAKNIELNASGPDNQEGNVIIDANEKVLIRAPVIDVSAKASAKFFSEKTVEVIGNQLLNIYGGFIDAADGATKKRGSKVPSQNEENARKLGQ